MSTEYDIIREALEDSYQHFLGMWQMATGPLTKADADVRINRNRDAMSAVDRLQAQQQPTLVGGGGMTADEAMEIIDQATDEDLKRNDPDLWERLRVEFDFFLSRKRDAAKSATPPQQQPKRLTDENIKSIVAIAFPTDTKTESIRGMEDGFAMGLRYARDQGYLGGLTVEDVMEIVGNWRRDNYMGLTRNEADQDLRGRLTKATETQTNAEKS